MRSEGTFRPQKLGTHKLRMKSKDLSTTQLFFVFTVSAYPKLSLDLQCITLASSW